MKSFIKRRKVALIVTAAVIIIAIIALTAGGSSTVETVQPVKGDLVRTVELSGKVVPSDDADLAFEVGGTVSAVYKKVGDKVAAGEILVELDRSGTRADLLKAQADLDVARAELAKLSGGAELQAQITNSKTRVVQDILDAYTNANDAVLNKVDQFFEDPRTQNPRITYAFKSLTLRDKVNAERIVAGEVLAKWKLMIDKLSASTYTPNDLTSSQSYLRTIGSFLDTVSLAVNSFETNSSLTQASIDKYRSDVSAARQNVNSAASALITGEKTLTSDVSDVPVQAARVSGAEATVANYQAKLSKMTLRSPIAGVISKQDAKAGESIAPNVIVSAVISQDYKIEAFVPEVSVAGVTVGAKAKVSLDAYGKDTVFDAVISSIEPRETIRDGVSTYKIELAFNTADERIRSGMTSNISIETLRKPDVTLLPARALNTAKGAKTVSVRDANGDIVTRTVEVGELDTQGNIEIISGVDSTDVILLNPAI
ncbi:MAG TPA: HlyD family efflux transporter periplasmic adaptor subunit [Candidatus Paceibacterota bacterium]